MSQHAQEAINMGDRLRERMDTGAGGIPQSAQNQSSQGGSSFSDGSGPIFNMYVKMAEEEDNKMAERWKSDADGILIFTGLFSAAVAALAALSIQDLRPNSQDTIVFYLGNIYQLLADPNITRASILATPLQPPPFSPPKYAIWVNSFWLLSLVISLTCALLATLLQRWARRYVTVTQPPRFSPHKRARIRAFFADGMDKLHLPWAVEVLPILLHTSLFLFFSGLLVYLFNINHTVFSLVVWWVGLSGGVYVCITLLPIFRLDSPYYAPLSSVVWALYAGVPYGIFRILESITLSYPDRFSAVTWERFNELMRTYSERLFGGMVKTAQETASKMSEEIDGRTLRWTLDALDEDHELEQFFEGMSGFCSSKVVVEPKRAVAEQGDWRFAEALAGLLSRTWSSGLLSETVKERRAIGCMRAADTLDLPFPGAMFMYEVFDQGTNGAFLRSIQFGHSLRNRCHSSHGDSALFARCIISGTIATVLERDHRWKALVMDQLGITEGVLGNYLGHGDSVLLANLTQTTCQFFRFYRPAWVGVPLLGLVLGTISKFDVRNTLPELQHDFCALWNEIVLEASKDSDGSHVFMPRQIPFWVLRPIRHIYIALHQGTNAAPVAFDAYTDDSDPILDQLSSYPSCDIPGHHCASESTRLPSHPSPDPAHTPPMVQSITVVPQHSTDIGSVPPSPTPGTSSSPLPATIPSSALPLALQSSLTPITSRIDQVIPGPRLLLSTSVSGISSAPHTFIPQPNIGPSDATFNTHNLSDNVEASQRLHQLATSVHNTSPDLDSEPLRHSLDTDTATSTRDSDRPR